MIRFPNAKINIGLNIISKRPDGYHNLETIFYPVEWCDIIEILPTDGETELNTSGLVIKGNMESNLCLKAYRQLSQQFNIPQVKMHLHKIIPMGAGLGGGSADGAFTLQMLNEMFTIGLSRDELEAAGLKLGSDCPFFMHNCPVFATGTGEEITNLDWILTGYHICILKPPIHVTTQEAFSIIKPQQPKESLANLIKLPVEKWRDHIFNDFEEPVFTKFSGIQELKELLYSSGALYASMSGSGSAVYGIFKNKPDLKAIQGVISWIGILKIIRIPLHGLILSLKFALVILFLLIGFIFNL